MNAQNLREYGAITVSVLTMAVYVATLIVAIVIRNENMLLMLVGASIAMAQSVVGYWVGSSSSSAKKDDALLASVTPPKETP